MASLSILFLLDRSGLHSLIERGSHKQKIPYFVNQGGGSLETDSMLREVSWEAVRWRKELLEQGILLSGSEDREQSVSWPRWSVLWTSRS